MGFFYIDDSIHDAAGFILAACLYLPEDPAQEIDEIIVANGFDPLNFEFKSSARFSADPKKIDVRNDLFELISNCRLGIVVIPREKRDQLGYECLKGVKQFLDSNNKIEYPISVYLDEGMFKSKKEAERAVKSEDIANCSFFCEQNSKEVKGIQLADLAAHTASIHMKGRMGLITKTIKAGENSGYDPDLDIELDFLMWATLRYNFFNEGSKVITHDPIEDATLKVEPYGLYVSPFCSDLLAEKVRVAFSTVYLGCLH